MTSRTHESCHEWTRYRWVMSRPNEAWSLYIVIVSRTSDANHDSIRANAARELINESCNVQMTSPIHESCHKWRRYWWVMARIHAARMNECCHKIVGLFWKRDLQKRLYSAKETYNLKEPTNHSHQQHRVWMSAVITNTWVVSRTNRICTICVMQLCRVVIVSRASDLNHWSIRENAARELVHDEKNAVGEA